jgi:hypothetical protein
MAVSNLDNNVSTPPLVSRGFKVALILSFLFVTILYLVIKSNISNQNTISSTFIPLKSSPSPTPVILRVIEEKRYTNAKYNFSFSYPQNWEISESENTVSLSLNDGIKTKNTTQSSSLVYKIVVKVTQLNNNISPTPENNSIPHTTILVNNGLSYLIAYVPDPKATISDKYLSIYNQIVKSFTFSDK